MIFVFLLSFIYLKFIERFGEIFLAFQNKSVAFVSLLYVGGDFLGVWNLSVLIAYPNVSCIEQSIYL